MTTKQSPSTTQKVANRLVELCRTGKFSEAQDELFAKDAESIEPETAQSTVKHARGLDAIKEKGKQWNEQVKENHGGYVSEPLVAGDHITVTMGMDVTTKDGQRSKMDEVIVYKVKDGKIASEQFFY
jgi:ketosteroid isomerase-like protein